MKRFPHPKAVTTLVALAALALITSCSSASSSSSASSGSSGSSGSGSQGNSGGSSLQTVTLGLTSYNSLHIWVIVAKDQGLMKPYGINFQPETFQDVAEIIPGIVSGSLDFGLSTVEGAFAAQSKGGQVKIVGLENVKNPYQVITAKSVTSVDGLKGGTIAVDSIGTSADYVTAKILLQHAGLGASAYSFVNGGAPATRVAGLLSGTIKGTLNFPPGTEQLTEKGMKVLLNAGDEPYFQQVAISSVLADPSWYNSHHALAVNFMKGYLATLQYMYNPKNEATVVADIASTESVNQALAMDTYKFFIQNLKAETTDPVVSLPNLENEIHNDQVAGVGNLPAPTASGLAGRYDNSLIDAAMH